MRSKASENCCAEAIVKLSGGDMSALTVIYENLGRQIYSLAFSILNNQADAEDAMQDCFLRLSRRAGSFDPAGNARAWIMAVARNIAIDKLRERKETPSSGEPEYDSAPAGGDFTRAVELNAVLDILPEEDRHIVVLKAVDGFKYGEIGEMIGISPEAARQRYRRAVSRLRDEYKKGI